MDLLAHAGYSATICSRTGLAGGRLGLPGKRWYRDPTVWSAVSFGLLPDIISMWTPFLVFYISGTAGNFFHYFDGHWIVVYRYMHSMVTAFALSLVVLLLYRALFVPSLAFALHLLCDAISHSEGKFQTMPLYPFSEWGINGIPFWRHLWFVGVYWTVLAAIWIFLVIWRRRKQNGNNSYNYERST
ncbi:MAG: hypothetical protein PHR77_13520 [Kiritimatiellae bacterium]|nr:hypothetical protein [Kiritimatiellia bacterium]MDD5521648.1 hypothetical protein [Kiritimatiellia bacterium]